MEESEITRRHSEMLNQTALIQFINYFGDVSVAVVCAIVAGAIGIKLFSAAVGNCLLWVGFCLNKKL